MKKILREKKGITLVALVITIIVLVILAAVSINLILGENGIINRVKNARDKYSEAQDNETNLVEGYLSILDSNGNPVVTSARESAWDGATMLTVTISNISGGTFTINVNNVEAHNYGTLYYYVNDTLVYSGTNSSHTVTQLNGNPITDNTKYEIQVLADPFKIEVTTGEGDNVSSWLACIGNPNSQKYTTSNLNELFANETLMNDLLSSNEALEYLFKSTQIILPYALNNASNSQTKKLKEAILSNNSNSTFNLIKEANISDALVYNKDTKIGTAGGRNYCKTNDGIAIAGSFFGTNANGAQFIIVGKSENNVLGYCSYNKNGTGGRTIDTIVYNNNTYYYCVLPYCWNDGTQVSSTDNGVNLGSVASNSDAARELLKNYFGD